MIRLWVVHSLFLGSDFCDNVRTFRPSHRWWLTVHFPPWGSLLNTGDVVFLRAAFWDCCFYWVASSDHELKLRDVILTFRKNSESFRRDLGGMCGWADGGSSCGFVLLLHGSLAKREHARGRGIFCFMKARNWNYCLTAFMSAQALAISIFRIIRQACFKLLSRTKTAILNDIHC